MNLPLGPASATLETELQREVRRHGIVFWLDRDGHYGRFVERLIELRKAGRLAYDVLAFSGSHLELMLALEPLAAGTEKPLLIMHLPGFLEEDVHATPLLELYRAGKRYKKALATLVAEAAAGRVAPDQVEAFRDRGELTLDGADEWLAALAADPSGLTAVLTTIALPALADDLLGGGFVAGRFAAKAERPAIWQRLGAAAGVPAAWRQEAAERRDPRAEDVAFTLAGWTLCVEYVDDLKRDPVDPALAGAGRLARPLIDACRELAAHLRDRHPEFYRRTAEEIEARLADEVESARAEDLGMIDTFRFEEEKVLAAALTALAEQQWRAALTWAEARLAGDAFWLRDDPSRQAAWQLVHAAARLGQAIEDAGPALGVDDSLDSAVERYVEYGARVDTAHRHLEQRRAALLYPQLPDFETLRRRLDALRLLWREWADVWARDWNRLCRHRGFLPEPELQQRTLFEQVVQPLTREAGTTALFMVDALRFEMGEELRRALGQVPATTAELSARLAELPTVTPVGMNALAPIADSGRLKPAMARGGIAGFETGEFRVATPENRRRAMHARAGGDTCPLLGLENVVSREAKALKRSIARARLVVVHARELDDAGEKGVGPAVFDHILQRLRAAWRLLREAGVRNFVITADHGFLWLDDNVKTVQSHGRKIDPKRRHVLAAHGADHAGETRVALADLAYDGAPGHLMFPETTAVFDTGRGRAAFAHGGNSLQERVVPVLTLRHRAPAGSTSLRYVAAGKAVDGVAGMHCVEGRVEPAEQVLDFFAQQEIELALRVVDDPEVEVEIGQARGGARLAGGAARVQPGETFELFFRLFGPADRRVLVELHHPTAAVEVTPGRIEGRFTVAAVGSAAPQPKAPPAAPQAAATREPEPQAAWLEQLPSTEVRRFFEHLSSHGTVTEAEASGILGSPRAARRFSLQFEKLAELAPFAVRIEVVAGVKRYVRQGSPGGGGDGVSES